jgi:hypothetical protein
VKKIQIQKKIGIGLEPVVPSSTNDVTSMDDIEDSHRGERDPSQVTTTADVTSASLELLAGRIPEISLRTQLDYARRGHAVLRSFVPRDVIRELRDELTSYASDNELMGWRQKVEVQLAEDTSWSSHDDGNDNDDDGVEERRRGRASTIAMGLETIEDCESYLEGLGLDPSMGDLPFLQHFNAWRSPDASRDVPTVRGLCLSPYLGRAASMLLDSNTVRLYQDSLFHKRPGDGWTPWHSDARMAPFDTSRMVSFWIPLQDVPSPEDGGTGLHFVDGSHSDVALPYWNGSPDTGNVEHDRLEIRYEGEANGMGGVKHHMPLEVGDVTVHNGWTLHCADGADEDDIDRYALSITYVDGRAELRDDVLSSTTSQKTGCDDDAATRKTNIAKDDKEDVWSFRSWVSEVEPRTRFRHPMVPIVWPPTERDDAR